MHIKVNAPIIFCIDMENISLSPVETTLHRQSVLVRIYIM
jgi:hypothetical protein